MSPPLEDAEDVGEIVGPDTRGGVGFQGTPALVGRYGFQVVELTGHDHPIGGFLAVGVGGEVQAMERDEAGVVGKIPDHRLEVEASIADVEREQAVVGQLGEVQADRFAGDEVDGNRVGTERVDDEEMVVVIGCVCEPEARVAEDDVDGFGGAEF